MGRVKRWAAPLVKATDWHDVIKTALTLRASVAPWIYGLNKMQKEGCPLWPIVNTIGSPSYDLSKYLAGLLKPLLGHIDMNVWNSAVLVETLGSLTLAPMDLLVSLDVVSLFTRIPLRPTLEVLTPLFPEATVKQFEFI